MSLYLLMIPLALLLFAATLLAYYARKRKRNPLDTHLIESSAIVARALTPEGSVLVRGELWLARSNKETFIPSQTPVTVVGLDRHVLLIEEQHQ